MPKPSQSILKLVEFRLAGWAFAEMLLLFTSMLTREPVAKLLRR
jgi:hypothetical protein